MELRPYQKKAVDAVLKSWEGFRAVLVVLPTGTGKTVVFARITEEVVRRGGRVLILAHRAELLEQAAAKLEAVTGLGCAVEKAQETAEDTWYSVTVGSVQSFNERRLERIRPDDYTHIIIDEAHHTLASSYLRILEHFPAAKVLGVTATADRGDKRDLGNIYEYLAYEMSLPKAVTGGWLCRISIQTIPLALAVGHSGGGDYTASECATALDPYLEDIAREVAARARDRKTVVFLPLIATAQRFRDLVEEHGLEAREVNGQSEDRRETLEWFSKAGPGSVLCNAMLLTEGWDEPSADCVCVLRPTKVRALYAQMIGRGTRLSPGKKNLLVLDFLWMCDRHDLCRPVHLVSQNPDLQQRIAEIMAEGTEEPEDLLEAADEAESTAREEREETLARELEAQRRKTAKLVDPLQYRASAGIAADDGEEDGELAEMGEATDAQRKCLEKSGINGEGLSKGQAHRLIAALKARREKGLSTPRQIRCLERFGFREVGGWPFESAQKIIAVLSRNSWRIPQGVNPCEYRPKEVRQ